MAALTWDSPGSRFFETGIEKGVLYRKGGLPAVPWIGLTAVTNESSGGETIPRYLDGKRFASSATLEEYEATLEAYTFPDEFALCDGTAEEDGIGYAQQDRLPFDLAYRTKIGNDVDGPDHAYKIHLIYNAMAEPSEAGYQTIGDSTEPISFSWKLTTTAVDIPGFKPSAHITIDSRKVQPKTLRIIEDYLYGTDLAPPRMLFPTDIKEILPWLYFEVVPNTTTGIAQLVVSEILDVRGDPAEGIYRRTPESRLRETEPGIYTLDV